MAMATATAMAGLLLLLLLPRDAATEDPMHRALFDHIQQIRNLARNSAPAVVEDAGDWIGSSLVEEADAAEGDAAATDDLVQERLKVLQATFKSLKGDHSTADDLLKLHSRHSHDDDDDDDLEEHLHGQDHDANAGFSPGVVEEADAAEGGSATDDVEEVVQERLKVLEAALRTLKGDDSSADGDVVNLLERFKQESKLKLHSRHSHDDDDREEHLHGQDRRDFRHEHDHGIQHGEEEVDPLVQERLEVLEAALRTLKGDDSSADGDVVNLLERFKQESKLKLHSRHSHDDDDREEHLHGQDRRDFRHEHDHGGHSHGEGATKTFMLPEELAEEEDLLLYGFEGPGYASAQQPSRLRGPELGVWLRAMGCSLLVSLASLICLMLLPCIVSNGKPSEAIVNALASFGAGAMLGDAFLHQLPHAFGKSQSPHSHDTHQHHHAHGQDHSHSHDHDHASGGGQAHAHSFQDLSVGLAVLGGILLFFVVEKIVRRYEELSSYEGQRAVGHNRHHHQKKKTQLKKLEVPDKVAEVKSLEEKESKSLETKSSDIKKRNSGKKKDKAVADDAISTTPTQPQKQVEASGGFFIGYLNLFSDAVHNFTDGMALGSAFLLHGRVGGWSRTLFLLAHELPQEIGDFGILVKSGFSVFEALAFNFLSALVALAGTAVALMLGGSLGHSSFIEGFIAGGFIYMSVGGVVPSMHDQGSSLTSTLSQLVPMVFGMGVAVVISLAE